MPDACVAAPDRPPRAAAVPTRSRLGLTALAGASFVYVTAETLPVGLLPQLSTGLHVRPGAIGLLVTVYAAVAGLTAIPLTASLEHRSRRSVVVGCVALLALSQFMVTVAPDYAVVLAARVLCALAHGVFWSMLAPVAARLAPPGQGGRATALVFVGNSVALVGGIVLALTVLATVAHGSTLGTVTAVVIWGAGFTAMTVCLQAAVRWPGRCWSTPGSWPSCRWPGWPWPPSGCWSC